MNRRSHGPRRTVIAALAAFGLFALLRVAAAQWPPDSFTNLMVLPEDIEQRELIDLMAGFTRALGVRCTYCHVGEEGQPLATFDFPSDDKVEKRKARVMIDMVRHINRGQLEELPERVEPRLEVRCVTCHRGVPVPRTLQDVLLQAYAEAGIDSTLATYRDLRERYYGRAAYDFGEVPLIDVAERVQADSPEDALRLYELNLELNPDSRFAAQQFAGGALLAAFLEGGAAAGEARFREIRAERGAEAFPVWLLGNVGEALTRRERLEEAIALYRLTTEAFPILPEAHTALGDAYAAAGRVDRAVESYEKALELDPENRAAAAKLEALRSGGGSEERR